MSPSAYRRTDGFPPEALQVLGWTTPSELAFVHEYLREHYTGRGAAVELGCAFGRSTVALLSGLVANPRAAGRHLDVYDLFELDWFLHRELERAGRAAGLAVGDSFEPLVRRQIALWRERAHLHVGDIAASPWTGGPIEFLFIDIMKSWSAAAGVIRTFYPALLPGALVIQQDYKHPFAPQVLLTQHRLRHHFEPAWDICGDGSASVAFRVVEPFASGEIEEALAAGLGDLAFYTIGEIETAFAAAVSLVAASPETERARLLAARVVLFGELLGSHPESLAGAAHVGAPVRDWLAGQLGPLSQEPETAALLAIAEITADRDRFRAVLKEVEGSRCGRLIWAWWRWRKGRG